MNMCISFNYTTKIDRNIDSLKDLVIFIFSRISSFLFFRILPIANALKQNIEFSVLKFEAEENR